MRPRGKRSPARPPASKKQGYRALTGQDEPELASRTGDLQDREAQRDRQESVSCPRGGQGQQDPANAAICQQATP